MIAFGGIVVVGSYRVLLVVNRDVSRYLGEFLWLGFFLLPYAVCALIWLPRCGRSRAAALAGMTTSFGLLLFAVASSAWRLAADWGTDMQGAFVVLEAFVATFGVLVLSALSYLHYSPRH